MSRSSDRGSVTLALALTLLLFPTPLSAQRGLEHPVGPPASQPVAEALQPLAPMQVTPVPTPPGSPTAMPTPRSLRTTLTIEPVEAERQGQRPRVVVLLTTEAGHPAVGELLELYVNGVRENLGRTDDTGVASFRMRRNLPVGVHALEVRFKGSPNLLASSSLTSLEVVTAVPVLLIVDPPQPVSLDQEATIRARLLTTSGQPIADEPVELYLNAERLRRTRTDVTGVVELRVRRDLAPGSYRLQVVFPGAARYQEATTSVELLVEPAQLEIQTIPPLAGIRFSLDGRIFRSDDQGIARIQVDQPGIYPLEVLAIDPRIPGIRPEFRRWESVFEPQLEIEIPGDNQLQVGFDISHRITLDFVDLEGERVDPARITSFTLRSSGGGVHTFEDAGPHWLVSSRVIRTIFGIEQSELLYSLQDVVIDGSNVVNRAQQRFSVGLDDRWQVELLLYSLQLTARDALFGFPVGKQIRLEYPDGRVEQHRLSPEGVLRLESLPRGEYRAKAEGVLGISPVVPVALSRDQVVSLKVISLLDLGLACLLSGSVALGLLFIGRPHLMTRLRDLAQKRRGWRPDWRPRLPTWPGPSPQAEARADERGPKAWPSPAVQIGTGEAWKDRLAGWAGPALKALPIPKPERAPDPKRPFPIPRPGQAPDLKGPLPVPKPGQAPDLKGPLPVPKTGPAPGRQQPTGEAPGRSLPSPGRDGVRIRETSQPVGEAMETTPVLAIADRGPAQQKIASALSDQSEFRLVQVLDPREELTQGVLAVDPEIVIVDDTLHGQTTLDVIDDLTLQFPDIAVVAIADADDPARLQQLALAGARGLLARPISPGKLLSTFRRVRELESRRQPVGASNANERSQRAVPLQILAVYSPRGGTGVSTLAVNLAIALHEEVFDRVLLVDGKLAFGHLSVMLNLRAASSLADLIPYPNTGDAEFVQQVALKHRSGIHVLPSPAELEVAQGIRPDGLLNVLRGLRSLYDFIVVDAGSTPTENSLTLLEAADRFLLVCAPELAALHDADHFIRYSRTRGFPADKGLITLNRAGMVGAVTSRSAQDVLKHDFFAEVPDDPANAMRALNRGIPLLLQSRRSRASKAIRRMAVALAEVEGLQAGWRLASSEAVPAVASGRTISARAG